MIYYFLTGLYLLFGYPEYQNPIHAQSDSNNSGKIQNILKLNQFKDVDDVVEKKKKKKKERGFDRKSKNTNGLGVIEEKKVYDFFKLIFADLDITFWNAL